VCATPVRELDPAVHVRLLELGFEGSVLKRASSRYRRGQRSRSWLKCKQRRHADVVVRFAGRDRRTGRIDRAAFSEPGVADCSGRRSARRWCASCSSGAPTTSPGGSPLVTALLVAARGRRGSVELSW
jgi:hypothetical protein